MLRNKLRHSPGTLIVYRTPRERGTVNRAGSGAGLEAEKSVHSGYLRFEPREWHPTREKGGADPTVPPPFWQRRHFAKMSSSQR